MAQDVLVATTGFRKDVGQFRSVEGPMQEIAWDFAWVPFTDCAAPTYVCIDQNPIATGTRGQILKVQLEFATGKVLATSFRAWLSRFADDLEAGKFKFDMDYEMILRQDEGWLFRN
jgi:cell wall assembly regulator SMI1